MAIWQVILLSIVQGLAELLPVSSSAHVVVMEKLLGLNPSSPQMTLLLVMLHTGTMFAVIVYFWSDWRRTFFSDLKSFKTFAILVITATVATAVVGGALIKSIEHALALHQEKAEVELLFSHLEFIAPALLAVGIFTLIAGVQNHRRQEVGRRLNMISALLIGAVQGLAIPFRGFSRSGGTISAGLLMDIEKHQAEVFSFALAVVLTPPALFRESLRMAKGHVGANTGLASGVGLSVLGMFCAFLAGLIALKWLSKWLETGRWYFFGIYCILASIVVFALWHAGY